MGDEGNEQERLGFTTGRGWALEADPVEKEVARGLAGGLAGLSSPYLLFFQNSKRIGRKKREKGKRLEKGLWHADNFPELTKMSLNQEK